MDTGTDTETITPGDRTNDPAEQAADRQSPDIFRPDFSLRLVLVGKTGAGKSSSGNTILGRTCFPAAMSAVSVTKECRKEAGEVANTPVVVVDTPGLFDTDMEEDDLERKITKCINMTAPGPHAIIIVIQVGPFTKEERLSVEKVRAIFGKNADQHAIILFTHGDDLSTGIEEYISNAQDDLKKLIAQCGGRYHVFNNRDRDNRVQVIELLDKIDGMRSANKQDYYASEMYRDVEHKLQEREMELVTFYTNELKKQEEVLTKRFDAEKLKLEKMIEMLQQSNEAKKCTIKALQDLVRKKELCLKETRRYFESRQMVVRSEAEQAQLNKEIATTIRYKLQNIPSLVF